MYPRTNYEMTEADLEKILDACKPVPMIMLHIETPSSPQENANRAWAELGQRMGFDAMTVESIPGKGNRFFTAVPTENETQRHEREAREAAERKRDRIKQLNDSIADMQLELETLAKTQQPKEI